MYLVLRKIDSIAQNSVAQLHSCTVAQLHSWSITAHLGLEVGFPPLSIARRSCFLQNDKEILVDYLLALYNTESFQYQMDLKLD